MSSINPSICEIDTLFNVSNRWTDKLIHQRRLIIALAKALKLVAITDKRDGIG